MVLGCLFLGFGWVVLLGVNDVPKKGVFLQKKRLKKGQNHLKLNLNKHE